MRKTPTARKLLKSISVVIIVILSAVTLLNLWVCTTVSDSVYAPGEIAPAHFPDADCILVLGAGVRADGSPSHMLEDRLLTGIDLYAQGFAPILLMSGDHGSEGYDEVNAMKSYAEAEGVAAEVIFLDHAGFSTYESLYRAKEVFGAKRIVIVTQEYHLIRALYIAKSLGLEAVGVTADLRTYLGQLMRETREIAARCKDFVWCLVKPLPTYLGEAIDLTGSANVTWDS